MARQRCCGLVEEEPLCRRFRAEGGEETVVLGVDELEAIRLKDAVGLDQEACASQMGLSRPTFQRLLAQARRKVAEALAGGKHVHVEGGAYQMKNRQFECKACGHVWEEPPCTEGGKHGYELACPQCGGMEKFKLQEGARHACGGHGSHGGGCGCGGH